jgi:hypothetical protein
MTTIHPPPPLLPFLAKLALPAAIVGVTVYLVGTMIVEVSKKDKPDLQERYDKQRDEHLRGAGAH